MRNLDARVKHGWTECVNGKVNFYPCGFKIMKMIDQNVEHNSWLKMQIMNMNDRRLSENATEQCPSSEVKEERKVKIEEWIAHNDCERMNNYIKKYDKNAEGKN